MNVFSRVCAILVPLIFLIAAAAVHAQVTVSVPNASTTGTTLNALAKLTGAPSTAVIAATTDTSGVEGIVMANAGTSGNALVTRAGQASCIFDGATTAGDYVQISSTVGGDCYDAGATYPTSSQVLGRVLSTNASGGTYAMNLAGPNVQAQGGGGYPPTVNNAQFLGYGAGSGAGSAQAVTVQAGANATFTCSSQTCTIAATGGGSSTIIPPQGHLTLISGTPYMTADVAAGTTIFYDSIAGNNQVPYYTGSADAIDAIPSNEVSDVLSASGSGATNSNEVYDEWWVHSGANRICHATNGATGSAGAGWSADTTTTTATGNTTNTSATISGLSVNPAQAGWEPGMGITGTGIPSGDTIASIGPGANTIVLASAATATGSGVTFTVTGGGASLHNRGFGITQLDVTTRSYPTNKNAIPHCWNNTTDYGSVAANQATYLGSFWTLAGAGTVKMTFLPAATNGGANNCICLYNAWNRQPAESISLDNTAAFSVTTANTWEVFDKQGTGAGLNNRINWIDGLGNIRIVSRILAGVASGNSAIGYVGTIFNSTVAGPPVAMLAGNANSNSIYTADTSDNSFIGLGANFVQGMEYANATTTSLQYNPGTSMELTLQLAN
jgi:hypothetical protein